MAEKSKRLKKNISFSTHEQDIYDYLNGLNNASALIKRLVYNHMILEQGIVAPAVTNVKVTQGTNEVSDETSVTIEKKVEDKKTEDLEQPKLTEEELENKALAIKLDL